MSLKSAKGVERKTKIPIDTLEFFSEVTSVQDSQVLTSQPANGVQIHGLFLQGCGWDTVEHCLKESDKVLFVDI